MLFKSFKITANVGQPRSYKLSPGMAHMQNDRYNVNDNHRGKELSSFILL